jgi:hypothetical protein
VLKRLTLPKTHAIAILLADHDTVKNLFDNEEIKEAGVPADAEHAMVREAHGRADTPAPAARTRKSGAKTGRIRAAH